MDKIETRNSSGIMDDLQEIARNKVLHVFLALVAMGIVEPNKANADGAASPKTREALVGKQVAATGEIATATRIKYEALARIDINETANKKSGEEMRAWLKAQKTKK